MLVDEAGGVARAAVVLWAVLAVLVVPWPADGRVPATTARSEPAAAGSWPVDGPVVTGYDDVGTYEPGHRGVDLAAAVGTAVRPMRAGTVSFAGPVAGASWVTVDHGDGLRSSYGPLAPVLVRRGASVGTGAVLGRVAGGHGPATSDGRARLHVGLRRDGRYVDPALLLEPPPPWVPALVGPGGWRAGDLPSVPRYEPWRGRAPLGVVEGSRRATAPGWALPPNANHVVTVAGLGTDSDSVPFDATFLGHDASDVTQLSYAGRRPGPHDPTDPRRDQLSYGPSDVDQGVAVAARRLEDQLRAQWAREPGRAVDLVGHSMGGVVVLRYLLEHHDPADPGLPPVDHVVTLDSPLGGADLATAARFALHHPLLLAAADDAARLLGTFDPTERATVDLALDGVAPEHAEAWDRVLADRWSSPLANGTQVLTITGQADAVVLDRRSRLPSGGGVEVPHVVVPGGHSSAPASEAAQQVVHAFLSGEPLPGGDRAWSTVLDVPAGWLQRAAGAAIGLPG